MTVRNVQFNSAFCFETQNNTNIYKAREIFWDKNHKYFNAELTYQCPDLNCSALFTGVGITSIKPIQRAMHFRVKIGFKHDLTYQFINIINDSKLTYQDKSYKVNQILKPLPTHFILRIKNNSVNSSKVIDQYSTHEHHNNPPSRKSTAGTIIASINDKHSTSQLERLVDAFTTYTPEFLKANNHLLSLYGYKPRWFYNCFKPIQYFSEQEQDIPFIYYGQVSNVVKYATGYYIYFINKIFNKINQSSFLVSVFIHNDQIIQYHKKTTLEVFLKHIPEKTATAIAYFIGTYPKLIDSSKNTKLYSINFDNLNQLWVEWDK